MVFHFIHFVYVICGIYICTDMYICKYHIFVHVCMYVLYVCTAGMYVFTIGIRRNITVE